MLKPFVGWGENTYGQTNVPGGLSNVVAIAAGANHSLALNSDGTVVAWGDNSFGQSRVPAGLNAVLAISAGPGDSLAVKSDGTVVTWGQTWIGSVPSGLGGELSLSAQETTTTWCWSRD
jgi:alpha-tubulin suppressor-like RCC1 family protein